MGTGKLSWDLNGDKLYLSDVELGTISGTGNMYFTLELVTAVCVSESLDHLRHITLFIGLA